MTAQATNLLRSLAGLSWRYLWYQPVTAWLHAALAACALAALVVVLLVGTQLIQAVQRHVAGVDMVVGAKGSPLQLILAGVFQLDVPPGNIRLADLSLLQQHPLVADVIPLSLGDNVGGFRVVGTWPSYVSLYGGAVSSGRLWQSSAEIVLGHAVAQRLRLRPGDRVAGEHGLAPGGPTHEEEPYTVVGLLQRCGCVLDRLVLTGLETVWDMHGHEEAERESDAHADEDREITLALVRQRSPLAMVVLPRVIQQSSALQAAVVSVELSKLLRALGLGVDVLRGVVAVVMGVALLGVLSGLWQATRQRAADLALLRMLGATPLRVALVVWLEALWLALLACALGIVLGHGLTEALGWWLQPHLPWPLTGWIAVEQEAWLVLGFLGLAALAALIAAWAAYRTDVGLMLDQRG